MKTLLSIATLLLLVSAPAWAQEKTPKGLLGLIEITAPASEVRSALIERMLNSTDCHLQHETASMLVFHWQGALQTVTYRFMFHQKGTITKIQVTGDRTLDLRPTAGILHKRMKGKRAKKNMRKLLEGLKQKLEAQPSPEVEPAAVSKQD